MKYGQPSAIVRFLRRYIEHSYLKIVSELTKADTVLAHKKYIITKRQLIRTFATSNCVTLVCGMSMESGHLEKMLVFLTFELVWLARSS